MNIKEFFEQFNEVLQYELIEYEDHSITVLNICIGLFIFLLAPLIFRLIDKYILQVYYRRKKIAVGRSYALTLLIKYFVFTFFFFVALSSTGIEIYAFWTAGAALLVGVGLGLQQTFNDFASGIILLFEGTVEKGDWIDVGDTQGEVLRIGKRTSLIRTRRNVSIIVPNSKITVDNVINLSHGTNRRVRYAVSVGVAYGSDVSRVRDLLLGCADRHNLILKKPSPSVRFVEFGNSSLNFELHFWTKEYNFIEDLRSDLRFMIDETFRNNKITIPFPQRDLYLKEMPKKEETILDAEEPKKTE